MLYIGREALDPKGTDQLVTDVATGLKLLAIAARHPTQLYVAGTLSLLALGAVAVSYGAIALLITGRGWVTATVAALLGGIGAFCGAITNVLVGLDLAAAATAHASPDAAARFLVTAFNSGAGQVFTYVYFVSEFTAPVVMGFALWRSRRVPLWLAAKGRVRCPGGCDGPALSQDLAGSRQRPTRPDHSAVLRKGARHGRHRPTPTNQSGSEKNPDEPRPGRPRSSRASFT